MLQYDKKELGEFLKESREAADLTQAEVAGRVGHGSAQFISNIERGIAVIPIDLLSKLIKIYKANPKTAERIVLSSQKTLLLKKFKSHGVAISNRT